MPRSIGAEGSDGFRRHARPLLSPGKVIVATFTAGQQTTLPIWMLSELVRPRRWRATNVVAVFVIAVTLILILCAYSVTRRTETVAGGGRQGGVRAARGRWIDGWPGEAHTYAVAVRPPGEYRQMNYRLVLLPVLLILVSLVSVSKKTAATTIDRDCAIASSGGTCMFSLTAMATGNLSVSTRACTGGLRFRTIIARVNTGEIVSQVGTGSTVAFTGRAVRSTRKGFRFLVIISIESPVPSNFTGAVVVRFAGPFTTVAGPRANDAEGVLQVSDCSVATPSLTFGVRTDLGSTPVFAVPDLTFGERTDLGSRPVFAVPVVPSLPATNTLLPPTNLLLSPTTIFGTGATGF